MAKEFAKPFYNSKEWKECRKAYIISVFGVCERCGRAGYIVHHKEKLTPENINNPDVTLNFKKLEYVCLQCHNEDEEREHNIKNNKMKIRYRVTDTGDIVPLDDDK
jgi:hypothetical protein